MKYIFVFIGYLSYIILKKVFVAFVKIYKAIITGYYSCKMKSTGKGISIEPPVNKISGRRFISIGNYTTIGKMAVITAWETTKPPILQIGNNVAVGDDCHISAANSIIIGDGTLTGNKVTITDNSHGLIKYSDLLIPPIKRSLHSKGPVVVGKNVWIGDKATICPGVTIGDGAVIGANTVVTHSVPPYAVAVGNPARVIKITESVGGVINIEPHLRLVS